MNVVQFFSNHSVIACVMFCISLALYNLRGFIIEEIKLTKFVMNPIFSLSGLNSSEQKVSFATYVRLYWQRFLLLIGSKTFLIISSIVALVSILGNLVVMK